MRCRVLPPHLNFIRKATVCLHSFIPICADRVTVGMVILMKKTIKLIDLDCGHCADKIQKAVQKIDGVNSVEVNFLSQKMVLDAPDDRFDAVLAEAKALIKKIEPDVTVKA